MPGHEDSGFTHAAETPQSCQSSLKVRPGGQVNHWWFCRERSCKEALGTHEKGTFFVFAGIESKVTY